MISPLHCHLFFAFRLAFRRELLAGQQTSAIEEKRGQEGRRISKVNKLSAFFSAYPAECTPDI